MKGIKVKLPFPGIQIDSMRESDLPAVMEIERNSFSCPWDEASFREGLRQGNHYVHFLIARHHQNPIAFINFWIVEGDAHIANFAVSPDYRNRGVGKYLFAESLARIQKLGGDHVSLEVRVSNIPAQRLYKHFRFQIVSVRKNYYMDNREDAYVFQLSNLETIHFCFDRARYTDSESKSC